MDSTLQQMLRQHEDGTLKDKKNRIKEVLQEVILCGLSRAGFFKTAAFYGGTALRIFHGLDRFSEDLDFSLMNPDTSFSIKDYLPLLEKEVRSYGLNFGFETKQKSFDSDIKSAFIKGNAREHFLMLYANDQLASSIGANELIKIKLEVDVTPPEHAGFEVKYRLLPIPFEVQLYDMPSLFAGKIHAVLCRQWKSRIKGRDLYDYVFYRSMGTEVNLEHLSARLIQSGKAPENKVFSMNEVRQLLCEHFTSIDFKDAKLDVLQFIQNPAALDIWSKDFFCGITSGLKARA